MSRPVIGVLGAGQLGRMLALAGYPLGIQFRFFDHAAGSPAGQVAPQITAEFSDKEQLEQFADGLTAATFEFENVPVAAVEQLVGRVPVYPGVRALEVTQDRFPEKQFLRELGIETAPFTPVQSEEQLQQALEEMGTPAILKTRRYGYDGKGQVRIANASQGASAWAEIAGAPAVLEGFVSFTSEVSIISVRSRSGEMAFYPLVENTHSEGILRRSIAPAPSASPALQVQAEEIATRVLLELNYVGVLAIEFFVMGERLIVNEMAPRVHNSGHWTIEGAVTSQFENHLRAILDLPLGSTSLRGRSVMLNCIGSLPSAAGVLSTCDAHFHDYGKSSRPGRKVGHITICREKLDEQELQARSWEELQSGMR